MVTAAKYLSFANDAEHYGAITGDARLREQFTFMAAEWRRLALATELAGPPVLTDVQAVSVGRGRL